jgi:dGTPase
MKVETWHERQSGWKKQSDDKRTEFEIDYSRVVHSASFRRLQGKTQVFNLGDSDFYRTRLTHSMEVAQIGVSLLNQLRAKEAADWHDALPPSELVLTLGLSHDLGHPPFGHGGEVALNYCMREHGGFEGNGQSIRIASRLEKFSDSCGFDFTRRALLGILKYPISHCAAYNPNFSPELNPSSGSGVYFKGKSCNPPKCYLNSEQNVIDFILKPIELSERKTFQSAMPTEFEPGEHKKSKYKSLDCSIMDLADDISYGVHDLEDAIAMGLISQAKFRKHCGPNVAGVFLQNLASRYPDEFPNDGSVTARFNTLLSMLFDESDTRKRMVGRLVHFFVSSIGIVTDDSFQEPLLRYRASLPKDHMNFLNALKDIIKYEVIFSPHVQHLEFKGQQMVVSVFSAIANSPERFLPQAERELCKRDGDMRVICDYIAGMTDSYLLRIYERLFSPRMGSLFDRL